MYKQKYPFKANHIHNKYQMFRLALIVKKMRFQFILYNLIWIIYVEQITVLIYISHNR